MERVVLDSATLAKLAGHSGPFEVWNHYGQLVGVFHPEKGLAPPTADAELDAAFARARGRNGQEGRRTAAEGRAELLRLRKI